MPGDELAHHQKIEQNLEIQLAFCGVRKEEVNTVILSHMHFGHTRNIHLFRNADIYVPKADFMMAQTTVRLSDDPTTYCGYCKNDMDVVVRQYHLVEEETFIFPMDAVYTKEIYGPPAKASGLLFDRETYFKSIEKVRRLQKKYNATVIPVHDGNLFQELRKAPHYYE